MAAESLKNLIQFYDFKHPGYMNKVEWINLCSHHTINLLPDLASNLFEGLDSDNDGLVRMADILQELTAWEKNYTTGHKQSNDEVDALFNEDGNNNTEFNSIKIADDVSDRKNVTYVNGETVNGENSQHDSGVEVHWLNIENRSEYSRKKRTNIARPYSLHIPYDSDEDWIMKKELNVDGCEVYTTTPLPLPRYKSEYELEKVIHQNYPELLSPLKLMIEDFRSELNSKRHENANLEIDYLREKKAHREDLVRLEGEFESQIQSMQQTIQNEVREKLKQEYRAMIRVKESEIEHICGQIDYLQTRIEHNAGLANTIPNSCHSCYTDTKNCTNPIPLNNYPERNTDHIELNRVFNMLEEKKTELLLLNEELKKQEADLLNEKQQVISEMKQAKLLHAQMDVIWKALERIDKANDYLFLELQNKPQSAEGNSCHCTNSDNAKQKRDSKYEQYRQNTIMCSEPNSHQSISTTGESITHNKDHMIMCDPQRVFKVIMVGDSGVGKSSFSLRFTDGVFHQHLQATVGMDFKTKNITVDSYVYAIQLWDTAGQEKYHSLINSYFRKVDGIIFMYAVNQPSTFTNLRNWIHYVRDSTDNQQTPVIIVANKIDLRDESSPNSTQFVAPAEGHQLAKQQKALFVEISVRDNNNVEEAMKLLAKEMRLVEDLQIQSVVRPSATPKIKRSTVGCCF